MSNTVTYQVRAIDLETGEVVLRDEFLKRSRALSVLERQVDKDRAVRIRRIVERNEPFTIEANDIWGISKHDPWDFQPGPLREIFLHTSVTKQLSVTASVSEERAQMRSVDAIAHARGFNGISYSFGVFPTGRAYEGRGWRAVEAATEGFNSSADSICCIGNTDAFAPTAAQVEAIIAVVRRGQRRGQYSADVRIREHNEVAAKACPGRFFDDALMKHIQKSVRR